ncbi:hypothetical protein MHU86_18622 [Fragilaria crotonensis]|nr:hypothetical protein MHU86_18622 [Fragilaria crotonensis]
MEMIATHPAVCQVGDGELKGKDLKQQLMGASILENPHANLHNPKSVWQKACAEFPDALQAATMIAVKDACAQSTKVDYENLNQWFNNVKKDKLATGLLAC